jgi:hypothetical protein
MTNETEIARAVSEGRLPSPTTFCNSAYYRIRFTGCGCAWRPALQEFVYRPESIWLTDEMAVRIVGVPVVSEHPDEGSLNGKEFFDRVVGVVVLGFVESGQLMAVVRVIDRRAREILDACDFDTSPCVIFDPEANIEMAIGDDKLLIEGNPVLLDHLALVSTDQGNRGVWNRDLKGTDLGVQIEKETA